MEGDKKAYVETIVRSIQPSLEPLFERLENNPMPSDWGALAGYLRLAYHSFNVLDRETRIKLVHYAEKFRKIMNEKLNGTDFEVTSFEGRTILYNKRTNEAFEIGFTDIWSILASKNVGEVVQKIAERDKGMVYNIKYYPLEE